ncbi:hypothetical protein FOMA001_g18827 [Fusarium oxysporum f. sp. matthiolae]|nr:hypothetical protein FOMA001_g18827 [Fusarium oxysporum f. sp. matthiolae]
MLRYDGTGFTRVEADYSKPWLPGESRPEAMPGEDYSRPWFPAAPADQLMVNVAARATNKNEPKGKNDRGADKNKGKKKTAFVDGDRLKVLAIEALRQAEEVTDHTTRGTPADALQLRDIELREEEQPLPPGPQHIDVRMAQNISEEEFERLLPHLQHHLGRLNLQNGVGKAVLTTEKTSSHILEKIRVTYECQVPDFEIGQQLKEQTITISELQLLQIAPSIRQQLARLMQCRLRAKTTKSEND